MTHIPWLGARRLAKSLQAEVDTLRRESSDLRDQLRAVGATTATELEARRAELAKAIAVQQAQLETSAARHAETLRAAEVEHAARLQAARAASTAELEALEKRAQELKAALVVTEELALLQEAGVYRYRHPLTDVVTYEANLADITQAIKQMCRREGGAIHAAKGWTIDGSEAEGRAMLRDFSQLVLRAFNAEADNLVRGLKPYKLDAAIDRLEKVADTVERLGKRMSIRISVAYLALRRRELEVTADFLQKQAEDKEAERLERERLKEERKAQQEMERERARLEKERQHYENALSVLVRKGDEEGADRLRQQLGDVERAIADVDYRAANVRAGYVYVISNVGSFGEQMVKVGMTRRLDPQDRIRELSDASVPFNFDTHALFFSKDAVGIEQAMHERLAKSRVNVVNRRREFFRATPAEVKAHLVQLAGELLEFNEIPEALEYRQGLSRMSGESA